MKKVTSEQLLVGKTYYANNDRTTPLTFVKYDELGDPCFKQGGSKGYLESNGLASFFKPMTFIEAEQQPDLTLQEKFEQGWEMKYKHMCNPVVTEMRTTQNGKMVAFYSDGDVAVWYIYEFEENHTITPPAPKVERRFTVINCDENGIVWCGADFDTLDDAKSYMPEEATTLLEHEKQGDKWVFVKAHEV